jgi:polar amino acid transport system substrate-binding protein
MKIKKAILGLMIGALSVVPLVASAKTYNVGSTPTGMPFTFLDPQTNTIQGVMVDLIQAIGKDVGFEPKINAMSFSTLISSLKTNRIDIISAGMVKTDERAKIVSFSDPVLAYGEGLVVQDSDTKQYTGFADMKGMTVGIQLGTAYVEPARSSGMFKEIKQYDSSANMLKDLQNGRVDAVLLDYPIARKTLEQPSFKGMHLVESYKPVVVRDVGLVVRKDDQELLKTLNASIAKLKKEGVVQKILKKWGL